MKDDPAWDRLTRFFGALREAVFLIRREDRVIVECNEAAAQMFGYERSEMIGLETTFLHLDEESYEAFGRQVSSAIETEGVYRAEGSMRRKDGSVFASEHTVAAFADDPLHLVSVVRDISHRKMAQRALEESRDELRRLSHRLDSLRENERARIARGLHEELGQELAAQRLDVVMLRDRLSGEHREAIDRILDACTRTVQHIRDVCAALRPAILDNLGLRAAIEHEAQQFSERTGIPCELDIGDEDLEGLGDPHAITFFRIVQESLINIRRYAEARSVQISLRSEPEERLALTVTDDGRGFSPAVIEPSRSLGLLSMRERARALGGETEIHSSEGAGTQVRVRLPRTVPQPGGGPL